MSFTKRVKQNLKNTNKQECAFCGYNKFPEILEAAHIVPHSENPDANTELHGVLLCPNCHEIYDRKLFKREDFEKIKQRQYKSFDPETVKYFETGEWPSWAK